MRLFWRPDRSSHIFAWIGDKYSWICILLLWRTQGTKEAWAIFQSILNESRSRIKSGSTSSKKDMMDALLFVEDENGGKLNDEEIIDILLMYLNADHESFGHIIMWATDYLQKNPDFFQKIKAEQDDKAKNRPPNQKGMTLKEYRQMEYLTKVI